MDEKKLRHVVLFGFRDGTSEAEIAEIARRFAGLAGAVPGITGFEWGADNSPEGKAGDRPGAGRRLLGEGRRLAGGPPRRG